MDGVTQAVAQRSGKNLSELSVPTARPHRVISPSTTADDSVPMTLADVPVHDFIGRWYAAKIKGREEKEFARSLTRAQVPYFLLLHTVTRQCGAKRYDVRQVLIPGYIFICGGSAEMYRAADCRHFYGWVEGLLSCAAQDRLRHELASWYQLLSTNPIIHVNPPVRVGDARANSQRCVAGRARRRDFGWPVRREAQRVRLRRRNRNRPGDGGGGVKLISRWLSRVERFDITNSAGSVFMRRYKLLRTGFGNLYLHHILRSDEDLCLHDHPWRFITLVIAGGYREVLPTAAKNRGVGTLLYRPARFRHRVEVARPAWSLVWVGRKVRRWGFFTKLGWRPFLPGQARPICE
jgi:hypothetical protein